MPAPGTGPQGKAYPKRPHLADQGAELCGAQVSIDPTENRDRDDNVAQNAAQIIKGVDTNCRKEIS